MRHVKVRSIWMSFGARSTVYSITFRGNFSASISPDYRHPIRGNSAVYACFQISMGFANPYVGELGTCLMMR